MISNQYHTPEFYRAIEDALRQHGFVHVPFQWGRHKLHQRVGLDGKQETFVLENKLDFGDFKAQVSLLPNYDFKIEVIR
jgi:hypothetical protein